MLIRYGGDADCIRPCTHSSAQVHLDGALAHTHESYSGSTFNEIAVAGTGVTTVTLESIGLTSSEWLSLIEVSGATLASWRFLDLLVQSDVVSHYFRY